MKDGAHPSTLTALSFPDLKKVHIYGWVERDSFPVVGWRNLGGILQPSRDFLHHNQVSNHLTTAPLCTVFLRL